MEIIVKHTDDEKYNVCLPSPLEGGTFYDYFWNLPFSEVGVVVNNHRCAHPDIEYTVINK